LGKEWRNSFKLYGNFVKTKTKLISFVLVLGTFSALHFPAFAQKSELMLLLDRIIKQQDSYPEYDRLKASIITTTTKMDKNWKPKKVTVVKKILKVVNKEEIEEVLQVLETEKGVTKDITEKYIKEAKKQRKKDKKKEKERKRKVKKEEDGGSYELSKDEIFPFGEEKILNFHFVKLEDSYIDGLPVYVLESRAKIKNEKLWEGKYYIDKDSFDILKVEVKPSKNPKYIKEFNIDMSFQVIPEGYFVLRKSRVRINGGIFIKHVRMIVEEERSDYEIIAPKETEI